MTLKDKLLQKGISAEIADQVIAITGDEIPQDEDSSLALQKALEDIDKGVEPDQNLSKAKGEEESEEKEPDDKDDYDEKYMKKHMTRYMKENKSSVKKGMKDAGLFADEMKKAVDDLDMDTGAVIEMNDLNDFISGQMNFNDEMLKAVQGIMNQVEVITSKTDKSFDLMSKAAKATVDQGKAIREFAGQPAGRKGVIADTNVMQKAGDSNTTFSPEENAQAYQVLIKAVKENNSDAGTVIGVFESAGKNANRLNGKHQKFIRDLLSKEAN